MRAPTSPSIVATLREDALHLTATLARPLPSERALEILALQQHMPCSVRVALSRERSTLLVATGVWRTAGDDIRAPQARACDDLRLALAVLENGIFPLATAESPTTSRGSGNPTHPFPASFGPPAQLFESCSDLGFVVSNRSGAWALEAPGAPAISILPSSGGMVRCAMGLCRAGDWGAVPRLALASFLLATNAGAHLARCSLDSALSAHVDVCLPVRCDVEPVALAVRSLVRVRAGAWREARALEDPAFAMLYLEAGDMPVESPFEPDRAIP